MCPTGNEAGTEQSRIETLLAELNAATFGPDSRITLRWVALTDLHEQDVNANVMSAGMFNALVANIEKNAALESVPLCATRVETPDYIEIVSGHHRTRAARAAGKTHIMVLVYAGLTDSEIKAKQLAHNAIQGQSDPEIIKRIFSSIESVDAKMESFIDPAVFEALPKSVPFTQVDVDPAHEAKTVVLVFLPTQLEDVAKVVEQLPRGELDRVYVAHRAGFEDFKRAVQRVRAELEVYSYPTAVVEMARLAEERLNAMREERLAGATADGDDPVLEADAAAAL